MKTHKEFTEEFLLKQVCMASDPIIGVDECSFEICRSLVFEDPDTGNFYRTVYEQVCGQLQIGMNEPDTWNHLYLKSLVCTQVERKEITAEVWEEVE